MRPQSIVRFEQAYLASILLWLGNLAFGGWQGMVRQIETHKAFAGNPQMIETGHTMLMALVAFLIVLWLLIWYFAARSASRIAKWTAVVVTVISVLRVPLVILGAGKTGTLGVVLNLAAIALGVYATWLLFRPDAQRWFGENEPDASVPDSSEPQ